MFRQLESLWYSVLFLLNSLLPPTRDRRAIAQWLFALIIVIVIVIGGVAIYFIVIPGPSPPST